MARPLKIYDYLSLFVKHIWELVTPDRPFNATSEAVCHRRPRVPLGCSPAAGCSQLVAKFRVGDEHSKGVDEGGGAADHKARSSWFNRLGSATRISGDDRESRSCRLEKHDTKTLRLQTKPAGTARHGEHVHLPIERRKVCKGHFDFKPGRDPESLCQGSEPLLVTTPTHEHRGHIQSLGAQSSTGL